MCLRMTVRFRIRVFSKSQAKPIQFNTCQYINMLYIYNFPKCSMPSKYLIKSPHKSQHIFVEIYNAHAHSHILNGCMRSLSISHFDRLSCAWELALHTVLHIPSIFLLFCVHLIIRFQVLHACISFNDFNLVFRADWATQRGDDMEWPSMALCVKRANTVSICIA